MALPGTGGVGFAVPRAVGSIARRNRLKRRFRAVVQSMEHAPERQRLDWVVSAFAQADQASFEAICSDLRAIWKRMSERWADELASS
jgi:ribonuclease P protein component